MAKHNTLNKYNQWFDASSSMCKYYHLTIVSTLGVYVLGGINSKIHFDSKHGKYFKH